LRNIYEKKNALEISIMKFKTRREMAVLIQQKFTKIGKISLGKEILR